MMHEPSMEAGRAVSNTRLRQIARDCIWAAKVWRYITLVVILASLLTVWASVRYFSTEASAAETPLEETSTAEIRTAEVPDPETRAFTEINWRETDLLCGLVHMGLQDQKTVLDACGGDAELFCAVMAIADRETGGSFDQDAVGDNGISHGLMQINTEAQADRISELGVTDLFDLRQNVQVAVSYIRWIQRNMDGADYTSHKLYMAYNMGLSGAENAIAGGTRKTNYSNAAVASYFVFRQWLEEGI